MIWHRAILLFLFPFSFAFAQENTLHFEHIGLKEGLPQGQILGLLQDRYGYIWFGTMSGLIRYDGHNFFRYTHETANPHSLSHSTAWPVLEDRNGYIWIGSHTGLNRWDRATNRFSRFYHQPDDPFSLPGNNVETVFEDEDGLLWVGTDKGLAFFDGRSFRSVPLPKPAPHQSDDRVYSLTAVNNGVILASNKYGLIRIDKWNQTAVLFPVDCPGVCPALPEIWKLYKDREGRIWVGTDAGLFLWKEKEQQFSRIELSGTPKQQAVRDIIQDTKGLLWIATLNGNGMFRLNPLTGEFKHFTQDPSNSFGLSSNYVRNFLVDRQNILWIGAYNGLDKLDLNPPRFTLLQQEPGDLRPENLIYKAYLDRWGGMWFSTYDQKGYYTPETGKKAAPIRFLPYTDSTVTLENFCSASDREVWIATWPNRVIRYHIPTGRAALLEKLPGAGDSLELFGYFYMEEDNGDPDYIWFSSNNGLCRLHKQTLKRDYFPPARDIPTLKNNWIVNGMQAPGDDIYVLIESHFNGRLARFDKQTGAYESIETNKAYPEGKGAIHVRQFTYTPDGIIWMATAAGLGKFVPATKEFTLLTARDGLSDDNLMGIAADGKGNLWLKGLQRLSKYHPASGTFWHFNISKDMKEFNSVGCTTGPDGRIFVYGNNGFYAFYPDSVRLDTTLPDIRLTDFKVLNQSRLFGTSPERIRDIVLNYRENVFSFEYAGLHFSDPKNNAYRYRLEGFDREWVDAGKERRVTYTNLDPGRYTFMVMAANADGVWNPNPLAVRLRITPPPWGAWWAYCLYIFLIAGILRAAYLWRKRRWQLKNQLAVEHREAERLKDLDALKTRLYTNITHEFRTPLTVILGRTEQLEQNTAGTKNRENGLWAEALSAIRRNCTALLRLVNQMLDLSKLESGALPVHLLRGDIVPFLKYQLEAFNSFAGDKGLRLKFQSDPETFVLDYDPEKVEAIVSNLLSNALKFTQTGEVRLAVFLHPAPDAETDGPLPPSSALVIRVSDTGPGIPAENLPRIFDRFYQVENGASKTVEGTGIGLALTKELVKLLGGTISVDSEPGKGTEFTVIFPVTRNAAMATDDGKEDRVKKAVIPVSGAWYAIGKKPLPPDAPLLLIVEDNPDVVLYLRSLLDNHYHLKVATEGLAGLNLALEHVPDIILSDVMMPGMDGFQLCGALKTDLRTSHIPIILLTAKADLPSRIEGLQHGADAYLTKPFEKAELFVRLEKLVELRKRLQERYSNAGAAITPQAGTHLEDAFIQQVRGILEAHIGDEYFSIPDLCKTLAMSRAQLYRKFQALTDQSVAHYFRSLRLLKAGELLRRTDLHISEIAFQVGFKDPAHFTRAFTGEFGVNPSEWRKG